MVNENVAIALKVAPVILLIALGIVLEKHRFFGQDTIDGLKKLVVNISLPSLLFLTFLRADLKPQYLLISLVVFAACGFAFALGFLFKKLQRSGNQFYPAVFSSFVTGMVGYSLFITVFGTEQLFKLAILDIGNLLFIFLVLTSFLDRVSCDRSGRQPLKLTQQIKNTLKSPIIIAVFMGILFSMSGGAAFFEGYTGLSALVSALTMLANTTVPLILIVIGFELHFDPRNLPAPLLAVVLRILMMLSLAYLVNHFILDRWLGLDRMFQMALYTMFVLPPTFIIPVFIAGECPERSFVLNFLSVHLIVSLITFIILMTLLR